MGQGIGGRWSKGHHAFFPSFSHDSDQSAFQVEVHDIQRNGFRDAKASPVHQLEQGAIPVVEPPLLIGVFNHSGGFWNVQEARGLAGNLGVFQSSRWAHVEEFFSNHPTIETSDGGDFSGHGGRCQCRTGLLTSSTFLRKPTPQVQQCGRFQRLLAIVKEDRKAIEVRAVSPQSVR